MHLIQGRGREWFAPVDIWPNTSVPQEEYIYLKRDCEKNTYDILDDPHNGYDKIIQINKPQDNRPYTTLVQVEGFYWDPFRYNAYIYGKANHNYYLLAWFSEGWCISQQGAFAHPDNNKDLKPATVEFLDFMIAIT